MNAKSKKYYQDINKENLFGKQHKPKPHGERELSKGSCQVLGVQNHSRVRGMSPRAKMQTMKKMDSKKSIIQKQIQSKDKYGAVRLPKITKEEVVSIGGNRKKHCKSFKKMATQPADLDDDYFHMRTLSPKGNMKQVLLGIVKNKQNRHLASIDEEIDKLDILTKRYSCLRKDLVSIQEDILTMSFKQKLGKDSQSVSSVYLH